jgi:transcriptional regulator with XRE-family HTH domain
MGGMVAADSFGRRLKDVREQRHMTQQQLADLMAVDRKTVDNWEHGRTYPRNRAGALKAWAPELFGDEPDPNVDKLHSMDLDTADLAEMLKKYQALQAAKREQGPARSTRAG